MSDRREWPELDGIDGMRLVPSQGPGGIVPVCERASVDLVVDGEAVSEGVWLSDDQYRKARRLVNAEKQINALMDAADCAAECLEHSNPDRGSWTADVTTATRKALAALRSKLEDPR